MTGPTGTAPAEAGMTAPGGSPDRRLARVRKVASLNAGGDTDGALCHVIAAACQDPRWIRSGIMAVNRASGGSEIVARYQMARRRR